jgi:hypothetical protein
MSQLNVNAIRSTNGTGDAISLTAVSNTATANLTQINSVPFPSSGALSNRNLIINGAMTIAQRASSDTGTGYKSLDRWNCYANSASWAWAQSKDTDSPDGFSNSFKIDVTTAHTPGAADYFTLHQRIEAQDLQHLLNGSAGAKKVTLSFWVKSPKTGNHAVALYKPDNTTRVQTKTYSVSVADTWEKKTITYDGDTAGGGIANDNGVGLQIDFVLAVGSNYTSTDSTSWVNYSDAAWAYGHAVNVTDNTANNFYLTGVQLEIGEYGTDFEYKKYFDERKLCERYFRKVNFGTLFSAYHVWQHSTVQLTGIRATPTVTRIGNSISSTQSTASISVGYGSSNDDDDPWYIQLSSASSSKLGTGGFYSCDAEL